MTFDFFSKQDIDLLFKGFTISPLFYNFLIDILPELGLDTKDLKRYTKFKIEYAKDGKRISLYKAYKLWRAIEKSSNRSDIGLIIADYFTLSRAGIIGELFLYTNNLKESVEIVRRFLSILINNIYLRYEETENTAIFYFYVVPRFIIPFSVTECYAKICYNWVKEYTNLKNLPIYEINFYTKEPKHIDFYKKKFPNSEINFNQNENYIILDKKIFYLKNTRKNTYGYDYIVKHAKKIKKEIILENTCIKEIVSQILLKMPEGENSVKNIANDLNISESTLKRRLKQENTTFKKLTELIRKKLAFVLIQDKNISFEEISYLLGYSEYSPFFRAFKKWYKSSPSKYREALEIICI